MGEQKSTSGPTPPPTTPPPPPRAPASASGQHHYCERIQGGAWEKEAEWFMTWGEGQILAGDTGKEPADVDVLLATQVYGDVQV